MIKHVVMWKLKNEAEGNDKLENIELVRETLLNLKSVISQISNLEVGENFNPGDAAYDLVLITSHQDREALAAYISHPLHQEAAVFIGKVVAERKVVDFEC
jgi:hypothetical protein